MMALMIVMLIPIRAAAGEGQAEKSADPRSRSVIVAINGDEYKGRAFIRNSLTYVGIREFSMHMGAKAVNWDSGTKTATVTADGLSITASSKSSYITANGRYLWTGEIIIEKGTMYVPLRPIARAFGCNVGWDAAAFKAVLTKGSPLQSGQSFYNENDLYWLSRIIHAESEGEPLLGKVAVGCVVLNRVKSKNYPNTIYGVIFDKSNGVQFTPAATGSINCSPSEESIIAAKLCLDGAVISDKIMFFINEAIASNSWVSDNRPYVMTIGNHKFYA